SRHRTPGTAPPAPHPRHSTSGTAPTMGFVSGHLAAPAPRAAPQRWARGAVAALLAPSESMMRRIALAGLVASNVIILTGAAVRLSDCGLGCSAGPQCTRHSLTAGSDHGAALVHQWVEFGNRLAGIGIFIVAILVSVAAWQFRSAPGAPRRRDLVWLAAAQPG